jgi:hypothetical protein
VYSSRRATQNCFNFLLENQTILTYFFSALIFHVVHSFNKFTVSETFFLVHVTSLNEVYLSKYECEEAHGKSKIICRNDLSKSAHTLSSSVLYANAEPAVLSITVWNDKTKQNGITTACCAIG